MSQAANIPVLGLHHLAPLRISPDSHCDVGMQQGSPHAISEHGHLGNSSETNSLVSTPRNHSGEGTPRTPTVSYQSPSVCLHSPLRLVGRASPCSIKLKSSARLEGGIIIQNDVPVEKKIHGNGFHPRELSFGNLLDTDGGTSDLSKRRPKPIGLCPVHEHKVPVKQEVSLPISPRKRSRKRHPVRSSVNML